MQTLDLCGTWTVKKRGVGTACRASRASRRAAMSTWATSVLGWAVSTSRSPPDQASRERLVPR